MNGPGRSLWALRLAMVVLGLAIAAVLLARGDYVLGGLIGLLALTRVAFVATVTRRRGAGRAGRAAVPPVLRQLNRVEFAVAAGAIGRDPAEVRRAFRQGRSLADVAAEAGVPTEAVVGAVVADATARIERDAAAGTLAGDELRRARAALPTWARRLVHFHQGDRLGPRAGR